ncbi:hypothetical protein ACVWWG_002028 [Bradyrhizobium sp. LB7.2]
MEERNALMDALIEPPLAVSYAVIGALTVEDELAVINQSETSKNISRGMGNDSI